MKYNILLICLFSVCNLQAQWNSIDSGTSETLNDIFFVNDQVGYCVGGGDMNGYPESDGEGIILKTSDGGENWSTVFSQSNLAISNIVGNESNILVFGKDENNFVSISSNDNGTNWEINTLGNNRIGTIVEGSHYYYIDVINNNGPEFVLKQVDFNGNTEDMASNVSIYDVHENQITYVNETYDTIFKSSDLGINWDNLENFPNNFNGNNSLYAQIKSFQDTLIIHATYSAATHYSLDNGATWLTHEGGPSLVAIINASTLYGADNCCISASYDRGETWSVQKSNTSERITNLYFYNDTLGFAIGKNGTMYRTDNAGGSLSNLMPMEIQNKIKIYPNPVEDKFYVEMPKNTGIESFSLFNIQGKAVVITPVRIDNQWGFDVGSLNSGNYFLQLNTTQGKMTKKILIK